MIPVCFLNSGMIVCLNGMSAPSSNAPMTSLLARRCVRSRRRAGRGSRRARPGGERGLRPASRAAAAGSRAAEAALAWTCGTSYRRLPLLAGRRSLPVERRRTAPARRSTRSPGATRTPIGDPIGASNARGARADHALVTDADLDERLVAHRLDDVDLAGERAGRLPRRDEPRSSGADAERASRRARRRPRSRSPGRRCGCRRRRTRPRPASSATVEHVHRRVADERGDEAVCRPVVDLVRRRRAAAARPRACTATRSAIVIASAWSCVTYSVVVASRFCRRLISPRIVVRSFASRFESGSSMRNTAGSRTIARASATRWRWPPESWRGRRSSRCADLERLGNPQDRLRALLSRSSPRMRSG